MLTLAIIDPGAGAGGGLIVLSIFVSMIAGLVHFVSRRFFVICFFAAASTFVLTLSLWLWLDVFDENGGDRWRYSMRVLPWSFVLPLFGSAITGLPAVLVRAFVVEQHSDKQNTG